MAIEQICIERRFRGPPDSGNGGYVAGLLAKALGGSRVEVTLRAPPPLETALRIVMTDDAAELFDREMRIVTVTRAEVELEVPEPPSLDLAREAEARFAGFKHHHFPGCFVCGPDRAVGDGLRIFPGAIGDAEGSVAGLWHPDGSVADGEDVAIEHVWAALDCAGYFALRNRAGIALLGRIAAQVERRPSIGGPTIVSGWSIASEGRKHRVGTALHRPDGTMLAKAVATWVTIG